MKYNKMHVARAEIRCIICILILKRRDPPLVVSILVVLVTVAEGRGGGHVRMAPVRMASGIAGLRRLMMAALLQNKDKTTQNQDSGGASGRRPQPPFSPVAGLQID